MTNSYWDVKYYWNLHTLRMQARWENPVSYPAFANRLKKMNLHDAIFTPRADYQVRIRKGTPIQDSIRRRSTLKENNVPVVYDDIVNKYNMKPQKRGLLKRFISLFQ